MVFNSEFLDTQVQTRPRLFNSELLGIPKKPPKNARKSSHDPHVYSEINISQKCLINVKIIHLNIFLAKHKTSMTENNIAEVPRLKQAE